MKIQELQEGAKLLELHPREAKRLWHAHTHRCDRSLGPISSSSTCSTALASVAFSRLGGGGPPGPAPGLAISPTARVRRSPPGIPDASADADTASPQTLLAAPLQILVIQDLRHKLQGKRTPTATAKVGVVYLHCSHERPTVCWSGGTSRVQCP